MESQRQWLGRVSNYCPLGDAGGIADMLARLCVRDRFDNRTSQLQQVRPNDDRNAPKPGSNRNAIYEIPATPEQLAALRAGAEHWTQWQDTGDQCPSCGKKYVRGGPLSARPAYNSNTWVYNMLIHNPAGRIEPPAAINKKDAPGWAANDVSRDYYPTSGVQ